MYQDNRSRQASKCTPLLPAIHKQLSQVQNRHELGAKVFSEKLTLAVIEKRPVIVLCDMVHTIQATKSRNLIENVHPLSRARNNHYCVIDKSWIALNGKLEDLGNPSDEEFPHPYEPYFHFRENYDEYLKERPTMKFKLECEIIQVKKWALKIINISNTGYYGIMFDIMDFKPTGEVFVENVGDTSCILYEKMIKQKLEAMRLDDLRNSHKVEIDKKAPWSLFYYCRNLNEGEKDKKKPPNILTLDKKQNILKYNPQKKNSYVTIGQNIDGVCCLQFPTNLQGIQLQKVRQMKMNDMKELFNAKEKKDQQEERQIEPGELWSSDDELSEEDPVVNKENIERNDSERSMSEDSEDDPLKNLYLKEFQNMKIV